MKSDSTAVLVVGGGLVGLSAALFLAWRRVPIVLVDRYPGSSLHPRAIGFTPRTLELYRAVGLGSKIPQVPPGFGRPRRVAVESLAGKWHEEAAWTPAVKAAGGGQPPPQIEYSPCTGAAIAQDRLEPILRAKAIELGADVRLTTTLSGFEQDANGVIATLRAADGSDFSLRTQYMIAADGHSSAVREALGIGREGRGHLRTIRSVLFLAPLEQYLEAGISQFELDQPGLKGMLTTYRDGRWLLMFSDDQERDEPTLKAMVTQAIGRSDLKIEIITTGRWELSALIADRFTSGRVFLAGDAAHTFPPARGGYGANTGIEDAHNLSWKLESVISGASKPQLLDTYDAERRPIAWLRHQQIFNRPDYKDVARQADMLVPIIDDDAMEFGQLYRSAGLPDAGKELPPALRPERWAGQPGTRAPHVWVSYGGKRVSTLDLVQPGWVLLTKDQRWRETTGQVSGRLGIEVQCKLVGETVESGERDPGFTLDVPIERIAADPAGKSVLESLLPQVLGHPNYKSFKGMSLRGLQPLSQGLITDEALAKADAELATVLRGATLDDPVDPQAFLDAFGIGPEGASLIRPDGYIAWRTSDMPSDSLGALTDALGLASAAVRWSPMSTSIEEVV
jgi:putative polyketide hydroxylase